MKATDFSICLNRFLTDYLVNIRSCSPRTIDSYRYAFIFLLEYYSSELGIQADRICLKDITFRNITGYLVWLQDKKKAGVSTRNQRQAAVNSFIKFLMYEYPDYLPEYQKILSIPVKKCQEKEISYLKTDGMKLLMEQISTDSISGLRDYVMLTIMYTTGIRVSELIGIKAKDLSLSDPPTLLVHGKGGRDRYVPINKKTVSVIRKYISAMNYEAHERLENPLFVNHMGNCFTRQGVNYMIDKYAEMARRKSSELIPNDMSPHKIRHSTAMSLVASGVDLIYIRDLLGHSSVKTTEIYARADAQLKRKAIEAASKELVISEKAEWDTNTSLKEWLINFCRPI